MSEAYMPQDGVLAFDVKVGEHGFVALPFRRLKEEGIVVNWGDEEEELAGMPLGFAEHRYEPNTRHRIELKCSDWSKVYMAAIQSSKKNLDGLPFQSSVAKARSCSWKILTPFPKLAGVALYNWESTDYDIDGNVICRNMNPVYMDNMLEYCMSFFQHIEEMPDNLFANNISISFKNAFYGCEIDCPIPRSLFAGQIDVIDFASCFELVTFKAQKPIPDKLFDDCRKAMLFADLFKESNLKAIPESLFSGCVSALSYKGCFSGTQIESIPACQLFEDSLKATNFSFCFANCKSLERIGNKIFRGPKAEDYSYCFSGCTALEGTGCPFDLAYAKNFYGCFNECSNLLSISGMLFYNASNAVDFGSCFDDCRNAIAIPDTLFHGCTSAENFDSVFRSCYSIKSVPKDLFAYCRNATTFTDAFKECISLESVGEGAFRNCHEAASFDSTFACCTSLGYVPVNLFAWSPLAEDFRKCFEGCINLFETLKLYIPSKYVCDARHFIPKNASFGNQGTIVLVPLNSKTDDAFRREMFENRALRVSYVDLN